MLSGGLPPGGQFASPAWLQQPRSRRRFPVLPVAVAFGVVAAIAVIVAGGYVAVQAVRRAMAANAAINSDGNAATTTDPQAEDAAGDGSLPYPLTVSGPNGQKPYLHQVNPERYNFFPLTATDTAGARREGRAIVQRQRVILTAFADALSGITDVASAGQAHPRLRDIWGQINANNEEGFRVSVTMMRGMESIQQQIHEGKWRPRIRAAAGVQHAVQGTAAQSERPAQHGEGPRARSPAPSRPRACRRRTSSRSNSSQPA